MKSYLITDPFYYGDLDSFKTYLESAFSKYFPDFVCFRDKKSRNSALYAEIFVQTAKAYNISHILINQHLNLAQKLNFHGIHLTSDQIEYTCEAKKAGLFVVVSTHSLEEAKKAKVYGADAVTISPIFASPNKGVPKGIIYLKHFVQNLKDIKIFALGGIISSREVDAIEETGVEGFASIRYFI